MLEHKPHHVRRKIALVCTGIIALVLIVLLFISYIHPKQQTKSETSSRLKDFFNTVKDTKQSPFPQK